MQGIDQAAAAAKGVAPDSAAGTVDSAAISAKAAIGDMLGAGTAAPAEPTA